MRRQAFAVGLCVFVVYVAAPQKTHSDSIWTIPTALSLLLRHDVNVDEYRASCERVQHGCSEVNGHLHSEFPLAPSLIAAACLGVFEAGLGVVRPAAMRVPVIEKAIHRWESHRDAVGDVDLDFFDVTENIVASLCVATAVACFFAAARRRFSGGPTWLPWVATGVLAFGTGAFSTASRVLWQHGPAMLCACVALLLLGRPGTRANSAFLGAVLAAGWVCRPTMSLFAASVVLLLALTRRAQFGWALLGVTGVVLAFVGLNDATLGQPLPAYFIASRLEPFRPGVAEALAGNLVSPSRGLLIFTPLALFVPLGLVRARRASLEWVLGLWLAAHWLVISTFPHWWAGHSYGPRFWAEVSPAVVWLAAAALEHAQRRTVIAFTLAAMVSVAIHTRGATSLIPWTWNGTPSNIDDAPARLWDWSDPQFLRR